MPLLVPQGPALGNSHSSIIAFQAFDTTSAAELKNAPPAARALAKQNQQRCGVLIHYHQVCHRIFSNMIC